ncbi:winged helix-turn-helix domain-containing protein [Deinococcus yavapaiensis]|uniref:Uncharacterized protein n=1 Tax=Deinococcus yavapaiensis KR-236 TaxID=694435 RepID=A0A318SEY8_9DEIO|nr:winged helix-turn-helix domain-containing protein [Deinococcus yavapaiensis]PYE51919.1 hypothetical protein DES52_114120 [Deinococcus yavapaiensis KR-236]
MTDQSSSRVSTRRQAELLLDPANYRYLDALMGRECSAGELAKMLGEDVRRVHYLLGRLVDADLAYVAREEKRAGRPVKYYAMNAHWLVPFDMTDAETIEALLNAQLQPRLERFSHLLVGQLRRDASIVVRVSRGVDDEPIGVSLYDEGRPDPRENGPLFANWMFLRLTPERAQALHTDLNDLLRRHDVSDDEDASVYSIGLFLAPGDVML